MDLWELRGIHRLDRINIALNVIHVILLCYPHEKLAIILERQGEKTSSS